MKQFISISGSFILALSFFSMVQTSFAQTSEQNEKFQICMDYKEQDLTDTNRLLVNCAEFVNSDYDTLEEFLEEKHPELIQ